MAIYPWEDTTHFTWSNWVTVVVRQVAGVDIYPSGAGNPDSEHFVSACWQGAIPGEHVVIPYRVTNTGNGADTFRLSVETWTGHKAQDFMIFHDLNENGVVDMTDPVVDHITLPSQTCSTVLLTFRVPEHAAAGDVYYTALRAESVTDPSVVVDETWNVTAVYVEGPNLFVRRGYSVDLAPPQGCLNAPAPMKTMSVMSAGSSLPSSIVTHTIIIDNKGTSPALGVCVLEPLLPNENPIRDAYGPDMPLLINGTPVSLEVGEPAKARIITDSEGNRFVEIWIESVKPTQQEPVVIEFKVYIEWGPQKQRLPKATQVIYEKQPGQQAVIASNLIVLNREPVHGVQLLPKDPPVRSVAYAGESVQFRLTVVNVGETACVPEVTLSEQIPHGWMAGLFSADGVTPLWDTNNNGWIDLGMLPPGAERDIVLTITVPSDQNQIGDSSYVFPVTFFQPPPKECPITTMFSIERVEGVEQLWDPMQLEVDADDLVMPGSLLNYNLSFGNASEVDACDVVVKARLSPHLTPPIAFDGQLGSQAFHGLNFIGAEDTSLAYDPAEHAIVWNIPLVPGGSQGRLLFSTYVRETVPEGAIIEVQGELACALTALVALSNCVATSVIGDGLTVSLSADATLVSIGEENTYYIDVTNINATTDLCNVDVRVLLPPGLTYCKSSSRQDGEPITDPLQSPGVLVYRLEELPASSTVRLTFKAVVNAAADREMVMRAVAEFRPRATDCLESAMAELTTYVSFGVLGDEGIIVGQLCTWEGTPVAGVRVVLDNGRYAISDEDGRFSFTGVRPGPRLLRLDPATLGNVIGIPGGVDSQEASKIRTVVPTAGIAMINFNLTPLTVNVVTEDIVVSGRADR
jgi:uncharacterized repeat protein (TIGR01451 family)